MEEAVDTTSHNAVGRSLVARHVCGKAKSTTGGAKRDSTFLSGGYGTSLSGSLSNNKRQVYRERLGDIQRVMGVSVLFSPSNMLVI